VTILVILPLKLSAKAAVYFVAMKRNRHRIGLYRMWL